MSNRNYRCLQCGKELKKGEKAIIINSMLAYHPECYRQEREQVWQSLTLTREHNLKDMAEKVELFSALSNPNVLKESKEFAKLWSNQYAVMSFMNFILSEAERYEAISWLDKTKLKRKIENSRNRTDEVRELYNDWFSLTLELKTRQGYVVDVSLASKSSAEVLKKEAHRYLINVADSIQQICASNREIIDELSKISKKITEAETKRMKKQIDRIPKDTQVL